MNVNFKVLWFEDEMGWRPSSERSMKKIIESHNLVPIPLLLGKKVTREMLKKN